MISLPDHRRSHPTPQHDSLGLKRKAFAADFDLDTLRSMTAANLDVMSFVGFPQRYGYGALDELISKDAKYRKLDLPVSYFGTGRVKTDSHNNRLSRESSDVKRTKAFI